MLREQALREWNNCKEKINSLSNLKKWLDQKIETDYFFDQPEYLVDFKYLKEAISYWKDNKYCPNCGCDNCTGPTIEEVD